MGKFLTGLLLGVLLHACASLPAEAADVRVKWTNSTGFSDGTPYAAFGQPGSVEGIRVNYGPCNSGVMTNVEAFKVFPATSTGVPVAGTITGLTVGDTKCFAAETLTTPKTGFQTVSAYSNHVQYTIIDLPKPLPPVLGVIVTTAMELRKSATGAVYLARQIGTVPYGTSCLEGALLRDYYQVPFQNITLKEGITNITGVPVARCQLM